MGWVKSVIIVFENLPSSSRGIFWMIFATGFYALTYAVVRYLSNDFGILQLVFFRSVIGVVLMFPWLLSSGMGVLKTKFFTSYSIRSLLNYGGMVLLVFALANMQLQDVTGLMFTTPLFTVLFVVLFLGEKAGLYRWIALLIGFLGTFIIIRPGFQEVTWVALGVLGTSCAYALVNVSTKTLARTESANKIVYYDFLLMSVIGLLPAIYFWHEIKIEHISWIAAVGIFSSLARQCVIRALTNGEASIVMPFNFLKLPFTVCLGLVFFAEHPDLWTGVGAAVIFVSNYFIVRREAIFKPIDPTKTTPPI